MKEPKRPVRMMYDPDYLGKSVAEAIARVKEDLVLAKQQRKSCREVERMMKKHNISVADMAGCMHKEKA